MKKWEIFIFQFIRIFKNNLEQHFHLFLWEEFFNYRKKRFLELILFSDAWPKRQIRNDKQDFQHERHCKCTLSLQTVLKLAVCLDLIEHEMVNGCPPSSLANH
jgi:hypothetical protein